MMIVAPNEGTQNISVIRASERQRALLTDFSTTNAADETVVAAKCYWLSSAAKKYLARSSQIEQT